MASVHTVHAPRAFEALHDIIQADQWLGAVSSHGAKPRRRLGDRTGSPIGAQCLGEPVLEYFWVAGSPARPLVLHYTRSSWLRDAELPCHSPRRQSSSPANTRRNGGARYGPLPGGACLGLEPKVSIFSKAYVLTLALDFLSAAR